MSGDTGDGEGYLPTHVIARKATEKPPREEPSGWKALIGLNGIGVLLMLVAVFGSLWRVLSIRHEVNDPNVITLRIAHWQLESGYREALQAVIDDYNVINGGKVRVIQQGVTEKVYSQWLNVNLIAGSGPDMAEMNRGLSWTNEGVAKYFIPLGKEIVKPNPYNAEQYLDELEHRDPGLIRHLSTAPWRETFVDGMRGGYKQDLQDYYMIPTSFFTVRMFYNKPLLLKVIGSDQPPRSLAELMDICAKLRAWAKKENVRFDPLAGTRYHRDIFSNIYRVAFTYSYAPTVDTDLSGTMEPMECWAAFQAGKASLKDPTFAAFYGLVKKICEQFSKQFAAMDRDQAINAFAQQRAAFMASGSWDAASVFGACRFDVGVMSFPMPKPGEEYSQYGTHALNEADTAGGGGYGIAKTCKHPEQALDFLRFLSSHKWNQKLNQRADWLPITLGTSPSDRMRAFMPNPYGVSANLGFADGADLSTKFEQNLSLYLGGEIPYGEFADRFQTSLTDPAIGVDRVWYKQHEKQQDTVRSLERTIAVQSARVLMGTGTPVTEQRVRETVLDQSLYNNGANIQLLYKRQNNKPFPQAP